jgi:hypothetical protein
MADRTIKTYGKVWGNSSSPATVSITWNGQQVYNGTVPTSDDPPSSQIDFADMIVLGTWTIDTSITGSQPLAISVQNGSFLFQTLHGNYGGNIVEGSPGIIVTPSVDNYTDLSGPSTAESDGHNNVKINEVLQVRDPASESEALGKWNWLVPTDGTLTCDVVVVPARDVS